MTDELLIPASRQYMHNDGSGLLCGYDKNLTEKIVSNLQDKLRWAYCEKVGADSIVGLDSCDDYKEWLLTLIK